MVTFASAVGFHIAIAASLRRGGTLNAATSGTAEGAISSLARNGLHPELVATLLGQVEDAWVQGRLAALRGDVKDDIARAEAMASCRKVATSIVFGSEGDFDKAKTYMFEVCNKFNGAKGNHSMCQKLGQNIIGSMVGDPAYNREELNLTEPCGVFYDGPVAAMAMDFKQAEDNELEVRKQIATRAEIPPEKPTEAQVEQLASDKLAKAEAALRNEEPQSRPSNATPASNVTVAAPAANASANATAETASSPATTTLSPTRARLEETIRKTKEAIERHEKEKSQRALAATNVSRTRVNGTRNSSAVL